MSDADKTAWRGLSPGWWVGLAVLVILCAAAAFAGYQWWRLNREALPPAATRAVFVLKRGESLTQLGRELARRHIVVHAWDILVLARLRGEASQVKAGEYRIPAHTTVAGLVALMVLGKVLLHPFTIVPGTRFEEIVAGLEANPVFTHRLRGADAATIMRRLGHPGEAPQGRFLPDTYQFARGTSDVAVLKRAYDAMAARLGELWPERAKGLPFHDPYQALILASIVEKETAVARERGEIAGVFVRRLKKGMQLDADPTVIYGLGASYHGDITRADLKRDTPYNTYLRAGLPPTAICMPGLPAIEAALHPAPGTALYFVARGDGTHVFSDTLVEQERMIRKYQLHEGEGGGHD